MIIALQARQLADYITSLDTFPIVPPDSDNEYDHVGALFTDIVLQAGLNYRTVVWPRVENILVNHAEKSSREQFQRLIDEEGLQKIMRWKHPEKLRRMCDLLSFAKANHLNTCSDLKSFLQSTHNREKLRRINGFGPKTIDYTLKLLNFDTVAVDRHIYSFVALANISAKGYGVTKQVVEYAADFLQISRSTIDHGIWLYMSKQVQKDKIGNQALSIPFI